MPKFKAGKQFRELTANGKVKKPAKKAPAKKAPVVKAKKVAKKATKKSR